MGLNLTEPEEKQKTGFVIESYKVDRTRRSMSIRVRWDFNDGTSQIENLSIVDDDEEGTTDFTDFYETYTDDVILYNKVKDLLDVEGEVDLTGEPE